MPDSSVQVELTTVFQRLTDLVKAKRIADGLPPIPAWHFRVIDLNIAKGFTGTATFQRGTSAGTNPYIELEAGEGTGHKSGTRLNNESLEGIWAKSSVNGATEKLNILLQE